MSSAASHAAASDLSEAFMAFYADYYHEQILELVKYYPKERRSLEVDWNDLYKFDPDLADDYVKQPEQLNRYAEDALRVYDLPVDVDLSAAHVRVYNLDETDRFCPGEFSPTDRHNNRPLLAIEGQVKKRTAVEPQIEEAAFECQVCGTINHVAQSSGDFQEPHECKGCERQGPFRVNFDQSEFVDAQTIRLQEPPEVVTGGTSETIDIYVEDDLAGMVDAGDRVEITGQLRFEQKGKKTKKSGRFDEYVDAHHIEVHDTDFESIEISGREREEIEAIAGGKYGDLFDAVQKSIAPKLTGEKYDLIKECIFLQLVGGATVELPSGGTVRGVFHIVLIGDGSTGKSTILRQASEIAPRSVYANGKGATEAGMTASVVQDGDFGDSSRSVEAGALVHGHRGLTCVDEIDKVRDDVQDAMHGAMEDMRVDVNKWGINTTLPAETSVLAAGNPKHSRWDDYTDYSEQVELSETLLQRFALIFKLQDKPEEERDRKIGDHTLQLKEAGKAANAGDSTDTFDVNVDPVIDHDLLRKYVAYARQLPDPRFRSEEDRNYLRESYVKMRGVYDYDDSSPVPIAPRKLEDMHRLAEASARARLSEWIEPEDIKRAKRLIGESLKDYGMNEDGEFDADVVEAGESKSQRDRMKAVYASIQELQVDRSGGVPLEEIYDYCDEYVNLSEDEIDRAIENLMRKGDAYEPATGEVRVT